MIEKITKALGGARVNSIVIVYKDVMTALLDITLDEYIAAGDYSVVKGKYGEADIITTAIEWCGKKYIVLVFGSESKEFYKFDISKTK